jgi:hypothetical protein
VSTVTELYNKIYTDLILQGHGDKEVYVGSEFTAWPFSGINLELLEIVILEGNEYITSTRGVHRP